LYYEIRYIQAFFVIYISSVPPFRIRSCVNVASCREC